MKQILALLTVSLINCLLAQTNEILSQDSESNDCVETFDDFYNKFKSDSLFQITRLKFPQVGGYADYDTQYNWTTSNWRHMSWDCRNEIRNSSDSISLVKNDTSLMFEIFCIDCGFSFQLQFKKNEGQWYLTNRQENNY